MLRTPRRMKIYCRLSPLSFLQGEGPGERSIFGEVQHVLRTPAPPPTLDRPMTTSAPSVMVTAASAPPTLLHRRRFVGRRGRRHYRLLFRGG